MSSDEIVLSVKNVSKHYEIYEKPGDRLKQFIFPKIARLFSRTAKNYCREFSALNNISFDIKKGETVGIIGGNGSGKSTLLQIICSTLAPTTGLISSKGRIAALLELGSGFNPEFTGRENARLNALIMGLSKSQIDEKMAEIINFAEIGDYIDQPVSTYSSGMFMRLAFAVQAHIDPEILIVDEALAVGDAYFIHKCMSRFHELKKRGVTILLVTHDSTAIKTLSDKCIWLKNGVLEDMGDVDRVVGAYLADIHNMTKVSIYSQRINSEKLNDQKQNSPFKPTSRWGTGALSIAYAHLVEYGKIVETVVAGSEIMVEFAAEVRDPSFQNDIIVGYTLKNIRGVDIASSNNEMEGVALRISNHAKAFMGKINFKMPYLHPGDYAITINLSFRDGSGEVISLDHCENAIPFNLTSTRKCHVLMTFPSKYEFAF